MLKSMTGFGRGEYEDEKFSATVEMKTVDGLCTVKVDRPLAAAYHNALQEVAEAAGIGGCKLAEQAEVLYLARCPDVISVKEGFFDVETIWPQLEQALQQAGC